MMNFKMIGLKTVLTAAIVATGVVAAASAEALVIAGKANYSATNTLPTTLSVDNEFNNGDLTGGFTDVSGLLVNSVEINAGSPISGFNANYGATSAFLSNFKYKDGTGEEDAVLNLLAGNQIIHTIVNPVGPSLLTSTADFNFTGEIRSLSGKLLGTAIGGFSANRNVNAAGRIVTSNFSLDLDATPVPTPALLPGLLGLGAAALRKRKGEEVEAEAVEAEAVKA
jgi:hypothetical protein